MALYPWGRSGGNAKRDVWLREQGLQVAFGRYVKQAKSEGMDGESAEEVAVDRILEDWKLAGGEEAVSVGLTPVREDWYWAFEHYGDHPKGDEYPDGVSRDDAPSPYAWSLLVGAWKHDTSWKNLMDKIAKDLFGGDVSDDDDRAFIATGMPSVLRERFSGVLGEAKRLFAGRLPAVFGRAEGSE